MIVDPHVPDNRRPSRLTEGVSEVSESVEDSVESFYNRGLNLVGFGGNVRYDHAIAHFTKAIELNPDFANTFHSRANAYYEIADYTQAIQLNPDSPYSYWGRGAAYGRLGNRTLADDDYAMAELLEDEQRNR